MTKEEFIHRHRAAIESICKEMHEHGITHIDYASARHGELHLNWFETIE